MFSTSIEYRGSDGQRYPDAASMIRAGIDRILEDNFASVERAVREQRCPPHHRSPTVQRTRTGDKVSFRIEACCEQLKDSAQAAAGRAFNG